jgi:hypothetical protein
VCSCVSAHGETVHGDAISGDGAERRGYEWGGLLDISGYWR